jgi:hypothetical protein
MAVPVPNVRPVTVVEEPFVETAALGPISSLTTGSVFRPGAILELREPTASIALLPITGSEPDPEEDADAQDALMTWALSAPGTTRGITAPLFAARMLTGGKGTAEIKQPLVAETFDKGRFWSGG